jgi:hypothetical protein
MDRSAVAATIASVVVFTTMLLANAAIYSAQNSYQGALTLSAAQSQERSYASVLFGISSYASLARTQSFLQSTPMDCSDSQSYLDSLSGSQSGDENNQSVWYSARSSWGYVAAPASAQDDSFLPLQFDGYSVGDLNLEVVTAVNETFAGGLPSYSVQHLDVVHIEVQPQRMASQCLTALSELRSALSVAQSCNSSAIVRIISLARIGSPSLGAFEAGASASGIGGHCVVDYWVRTTQTGIQGVSGTFQWTVFASGSLST